VREQIFDVLHKWLYFSDEQGVDCILATAISALMPGDPLWMFVVAPPGGTKTELCRGFNGPHVYSLDTLTPQALLSGFKSKAGEQVDILSDLDGKLLVIKDFTSMLTKPQRVRDETFGRLRAAYDGSLEGAFGSGVKKQSRYATFGILAAVTPIIDNFTAVHSLLGERFIRIRTQYDRMLATRGALKHLNKELQMRMEIGEILRIALDFYKFKTKEIPVLKSETINKLIALANFTALARTGVPRNFRNEITTKPEPEVGTRLALQFSRLAQSLYVLGTYTYEHIMRIARDTIPKTKLDIIMVIRENGSLSTGQLMSKLRLPRHVALNTSADLEALEILKEHTESNTNVYSLTKKLEETMKEAGL